MPIHEKIVSFIKRLYGRENRPIPLHAPVFLGKEKQYMEDCIESTFVSSVGKYVDLFEKKVAEFTRAKNAVATVNGTSALHIALLLAGVERGEEVLTQSLSFVATANAITYCGADPIFLDSERLSLGLSPEALESFLDNDCVQEDDGFTYNKITGKRIAACVPMHVLGHPVQIDRIKNLCDKCHIAIVEDAAESIGSFYHDRHTGTFGKLGILSFNGNKTITAGGGGMILTDDEKLGRLGKHLTMVAKVDHPWEYFHDHIGFNYRLPNINAALGCAQMENLPWILENKRNTAEKYRKFFNNLGIQFMTEPVGCKSNYWLNAVLFGNLKQRNEFIDYSNANNVMTRPLWTLIHKLPIYAHSQTDRLENALWLADRLVNIPSSVII